LLLPFSSSYQDVRTFRPVDLDLAAMVDGLSIGEVKDIVIWTWNQHLIQTKTLGSN